MQGPELIAARYGHDLTVMGTACGVTTALPHLTSDPAARLQGSALRVQASDPPRRSLALRRRGASGVRRTWRRRTPAQSTAK